MENMETLALISSLLTNATLLYLVLLVGLWIAITAVHIPGTGVFEVASLGLILVSLYMLIQLPTNWIAVVALVSGTGCFIVLPYLSPRYAHLAEVGLLLQGLGGLTLFTDRTPAPLIVGLTVLISWLFNRFVLMPLLRRQRVNTDYHQYTEVIGAMGRVTKPLTPVGTVMINGELWSARSDHELPAETEVIVRERRGFELKVEKAKRTESASA